MFRKITLYRVAYAASGLLGNIMVLVAFATVGIFLASIRLAFKGPPEEATGLFCLSVLGGMFFMFLNEILIRIDKYLEKEWIKDFGERKPNKQSRGQKSTSP